MCGRYATTRSAADLSALFEAYDDTGGRLVADYNVAPTDPVPIIRVPLARGTGSRAGGDPDAVFTGVAGQRAVSVARWGLLPPWAKETRAGARMINARAESVATTRAYAPSFARRRCLIPADGWYEWVRRDRAKQAYFMTAQDGGVLAFAGLWSVWSGGPEPLLTCSIVTTAAVGDLALVHDRMPLLLPPDRWADWIAGGGDPVCLLAPPAEQFVAGLEIRPVGPAVGNVRNDGPGLVTRVAAPPLGAPPAGPVELPLF
ncbi:MAG TPA: SOS response-associated peptidase [Micromonospora sp.]|nr:SOS response-associated peptidase [Micromonospora sp.]